MRFFDNQNKKLVYSQVENKIRVLILAGGYGAGDRLPSVVEMASKMAVNPQHVIFAYDNLLESGMICLDEEGHFCVVNNKNLMESRVDNLLREFDAVTEELMKLDTTGEMLKKRIENRVQSYKENERGNI